MINRKSREEIKLMRQAGHVVALVHQKMKEVIEPGISTKELEADPWDTVADRYTEGKKVDGVIARVADFGVFVNLEEAIDGLVHISELDVDANTNLKKKFNVGDKMSVVVKSVDAKNKRISLTTTTSLEQDKTTAKYMSSQDDDGDTYNPFAALLKK